MSAVDTDSICSAIAYANLKNKTDDGEFIPKRAGELNEETKYVLDTFGVRIDEATIEQVFRHGTADIGKPYLDCITSAARQYVADIFSTLRRYEYNPDLMRLYIVGGGGCLIRNFGRYEKSRVTVIDDICATAKGYEALALAALRRKERP